MQKRLTDVGRATEVVLLAEVDVIAELLAGLGFRDAVPDGVGECVGESLDIFRTVFDYRVACFIHMLATDT